VRGVPPRNVGNFIKIARPGVIASRGTQNQPPPPARKPSNYIAFCRSLPYETFANIQGGGLHGGGMEACQRHLLWGDSRYRPGPASGLRRPRNCPSMVRDSVTEKDWMTFGDEGFADIISKLLYTEHYEGKREVIAAMKRSRSNVLADRETPQ